ncbi:DUF6286 domain-containing protein [Kribbella sp. NBC_01505]|uniref:DUF6286 domain-containing protein n=1 Tax=Kribbella sp. NBC_01505 TaxID=2903580 RepID=UPI00386C5DAF
MSTAAKKPVAAPAAAKVAVIGALAVLAIAAVAIRDTLVTTGVIDGSSWLEWVFKKAEVLRPADWMTYSGGAAVLIGVWVLIAALKPRKATHLAVGDAGSGVWIRSRDAARLATDTARGIDSVTSAGTKTSGRRKLRVAATTFGDADRVRDELADAIAQRLNTISPSPRVRALVTAEEN